MGGDETTDGARGRSADTYLEVQVDRETVVLVALAFVLLLGVAFLLGRWSTRAGGEGDGDPAEAVMAEASEADGLGAGASEPEEVDGEAPFGAVSVDSGAAPVSQVPTRPVTRPSAAAGSRAATPPRGSEGEESQPAASSSSTASPASTVASEPESGWVVQVAALADEPDAERVRRRLVAAGYPVRVVREGSWHKVQVGPYASRQEAREAERRLKREEKVATWIKRS